MPRLSAFSKRLILIGALLFTAVSCRAAEQAVLHMGAISMSGNVLEQKYVTEFMGTAALKAPAWTPDQENPPLSVRAAEKAATKALREVVGDLKEWKRDEIKLQEWSNAGHWIYLFSFTGPSSASKDGRSRSGSRLTVLVLMDGQAISPKKVEPRKV